MLGGAAGGAIVSRLERASRRPAQEAVAGVTDDVSKAIKDMVARGIDPEEARRIAQAQSLPVKVPLTTGQITGAKSQQLFEDMARSGAFGETPERLLTSQRQAQQEAIRQNVPAIREQLAQGATVAEFGTSGAAAQETLSGMRRAAQETASGMFEAAREAGGGVQLVDDAAIKIGTDILDAVSGFNPRTAPGALGLADDFAKTLDEGANVRELFNWRAQVTNHANQPGPEGAAAGSMLRKFDETIGELADGALLSGDEEAARLWGAAIRNYKAFANKWLSKGGILNALTDRATRDGDGVLKVAPEAASNYIFGASSNNIVSKPALARDLRKLKDVLPEDQWLQIKQEAFLRIADKAEGGIESGERLFSGAKFQKFWQDAVRKNPEVVASLFNADERKLIQEFATVASKATTGAVNASNSATAAAGALQKVIGAIGGTNTAQFLTRMAGLNMIRTAGGTVRALGAVKGIPTAPVTSFAGAGAGGAALSSDELGERTRRQINRSIGFAQ